MRNSIPIQGRTFLDVGCGAGHYSLEFANKGAQKVVGIDISEKMLDICHRRASELQLNDRCQFLQTDLLEYQPDTKFDVCIGIGLFDYIREPLPVLTKMGEVVQDRIIISLPKFWTWRALVRKVRLTLKGCDVFFYTKEQIDRLLKQAAFKRYTIEEIGQLYCITAYV
jgi:ubiquinone/menaquinone biosynthesis C-methylase UbiE